MGVRNFYVLEVIWKVTHTTRRTFTSVVNSTRTKYLKSDLEMSKLSSWLLLFLSKTIPSFKKYIQFDIRKISIKVKESYCDRLNYCQNWYEVF